MARIFPNRATNVFLTVLIAVGTLSASTTAWGQAAQKAGAAAKTGSDAEALAKKLNNPISDLVSVPFQFNWAQPIGPEDETRFILNVQPVMPFSISKNWNLIARVIMPFVGQPALSPGGDAATGLGDILSSFFFSPKSSPVIWGVGPAISLPSTNDPALGSGKWSGGPTFVILQQQGRWTYGGLMNQIWSFAGADSRSEVSQFYIQPFLAYTTPKAVTYAVNSESIANWKASSGDEWTIPINFMVSKVSSFGPFPASYQVGAGWYVETPDGGPDWQLRGTITLLLPRKK